MRTLEHYRSRIREKGLKSILQGRYNGFVARLRFGNPWVGRAIELSGNRVRIDGMWFSVDSPAIANADKCTIAFGGHEVPEREFIRFMPRSLPVVEFGGAIGVTSCAVNRHIDNPTNHVVYEPNPVARALLERNRDVNRCKFATREAALGYGAETVTFGVHRNLFMCKLAELGGCETTVTVPAVTLKSVLDSQNWSECSLVSDIEGGESLLIEHELEVVRERCPFLMLEIHPNVITQARSDEIVRQLEGAGFQVLGHIDRNWVFGRR